MARVKDEMSKQRMKLHMKVLGSTGVSPAQQQQKLREDKPAYKEKFVPPEVSLLSYLMTKVQFGFIQEERP